MRPQLRDEGSVSLAGVAWPTSDTVVGHLVSPAGLIVITDAYERVTPDELTDAQVFRFGAAGSLPARLYTAVSPSGGEGRPVGLLIGDAHADADGEWTHLRRQGGNRDGQPNDVQSDSGVLLAFPVEAHERVLARWRSSSVLTPLVNRVLDEGAVLIDGFLGITAGQGVLTCWGQPASTGGLSALFVDLEPHEGW